MTQPQRKKALRAVLIACWVLCVWAISSIIVLRSTYAQQTATLTWIDDKSQTVQSIQLVWSWSTEQVAGIWIEGSTIKIESNTWLVAQPSVWENLSNTNTAEWFSQILWWSNNTVNSDNVTIIGWQWLTVWEGNDNVTILWWSGNVISSSDSSNVPSVIVWWSSNVIGSNSEWAVIIGWSENVIGSDVANSQILWWSGNTVNADNTIVAWSWVTVNPGVGNSFIFSAGGNFSPSTSWAFYFNAPEWVWLNANARSWWISSFGSVSFGNIDINVYSCTVDNIWLQWVSNDCLVWCTQGSYASGWKWDLLEGSSRCIKWCDGNDKCLNTAKFEWEHIPAYCTGNVMSWSEPCFSAEATSWILEKFWDTLFAIDFVWTCPTDQNQLANPCTYQCPENAILVDWECKASCTMDWQTFKHGDTIRLYEWNSYTCPISCVNHYRTRTCWNGQWTQNSDFDVLFTKLDCTTQLPTNNACSSEYSYTSNTAITWWNFTWCKTYSLNNNDCDVNMKYKFIGCQEWLTHDPVTNTCNPDCIFNGKSYKFGASATWYSASALSCAEWDWTQMSCKYAEVGMVCWRNWQRDTQGKQITNSCHLQWLSVDTWYYNLVSCDSHGTCSHFTGYDVVTNAWNETCSAVVRYHLDSCNPWYTTWAWFEYRCLPDCTRDGKTIHHNQTWNWYKAREMTCGWGVTTSCETEWTYRGVLKCDYNAGSDAPMLVLASNWSVDSTYQYASCTSKAPSPTVVHIRQTKVEHANCTEFIYYNTGNNLCNFEYNPNKRYNCTSCEDWYTFSWTNWNHNNAQCLADCTVSAYDKNWNSVSIVLSWNGWSRAFYTNGTYQCTGVYTWNIRRCDNWIVTPGSPSYISYTWTGKSCSIINDGTQLWRRTITGSSWTAVKPANSDEALDHCTQYRTWTKNGTYFDWGANPECQEVTNYFYVKCNTGYGWSELNNTCIRCEWSIPIRAYYNRTWVLPTTWSINHYWSQGSSNVCSFSCVAWTHYDSSVNDCVANFCLLDWQENIRWDIDYTTTIYPKTQELCPNECNWVSAKCVDWVWRKTSNNEAVVWNWGYYSSCSTVSWKKQPPTSSAVTWSCQPINDTDCGWSKWRKTLLLSEYKWWNASSDPIKTCKEFNSNGLTCVTWNEYLVYMCPDTYHWEQADWGWKCLADSKVVDCNEWWKWANSSYVHSWVTVTWNCSTLDYSAPANCAFACDAPYNTGSTNSYCVKPECGTAKWKYYSSAPTSNLCASWTKSWWVSWYTYTNGTDSTWKWNCTNWTNTSLNTTWCVAYKEPTCGSAKSWTYSSKPSSNLCNIWKASSVSVSANWNLYEWTCTNKDHNVSCAAYVTAKCGSANGTTPWSTPSSNLCSTWTASSVTTSMSWSTWYYIWTCSNWSSTANCSAYMNAKVWSAGGQCYSSAPTTNLCATWIKSAWVFTNSLTYDWKCTNWASNISWSAKRIPECNSSVNWTTTWSAPAESLRCGVWTPSSVTNSGASTNQQMVWTCSNNWCTTASCYVYVDPKCGTTNAYTCVVWVVTWKTESNWSYSWSCKNWSKTAQCNPISAAACSTTEVWKCSVWSMSNFGTNGNNYTWTCTSAWQSTGCSMAMPNCGSAAGTCSSSMPSSSKCSVWTVTWTFAKSRYVPSYLSSSFNWSSWSSTSYTREWWCEKWGAWINCVAPQNPKCGWANWNTYGSAPSDLCATWTAESFTTDTSKYTWNCVTSCGSTWCSAYRNASCWTANWQTYTYPNTPAENTFCAIWSKVSYSTDWLLTENAKYKWKCTNGSNTTSWCEAYIKPGAGTNWCGPNNWGTFINAPTTWLCNVWVSSNVTSTDTTFNWSCATSAGNVSCGATRTYAWCTLDWVTVAYGSSRTFYKSPVTCASTSTTCESQVRNCWVGNVLDGSNEYNKASCVKTWNTCDTYNLTKTWDAWCNYQACQLYNGWTSCTTSSKKYKIISAKSGYYISGNTCPSIWNTSTNPGSCNTGTRTLSGASYNRYYHFTCKYKWVDYQYTGTCPTNFVWGGNECESVIWITSCDNSTISWCNYWFASWYSSLARGYKWNCVDVNGSTLDACHKCKDSNYVRSWGANKCLAKCTTPWWTKVESSSSAVWYNYWTWNNAPVCPVTCSSATYVCSDGDWYQNWSKVTRNSSSTYKYSSCWTPQASSGTCSAAYKLSATGVSNAATYDVCTWYNAGCSTWNKFKVKTCSSWYHVNADATACEPNSCDNPCGSNSVGYTLSDWESIVCYDNDIPTCPTVCHGVTFTCNAGTLTNAPFASQYTDWHCDTQWTEGECSTTTYPLTSKNVSNAKSYNTCTYYTGWGETCSSAKYRYSLASCNSWYYKSWQTCVQCPGGYRCDGTSKTQCSAWYYSNAWSTGCTICPVAYRSWAAGTSWINNCKTGVVKWWYYIAHYWDTTQTACPVGTYSNQRTLRYCEASWGPDTCFVDMCSICSTGPNNSHYTSNASGNNCNWACDTGYTLNWGNCVSTSSQCTLPWWNLVNGTTINSGDTVTAYKKLACPDACLYDNLGGEPTNTEIIQLQCKNGSVYKKVWSSYSQLVSNSTLMQYSWSCVTTAVICPSSSYPLTSTVTNWSWYDVCTEYSLKTASVCQQWTTRYALVSCKAWYYKSGNTCVQCPAWYACNGTTKTQCSAWYYASAWASSCIKCAGGKYSSAWASSCTACSTWYYSNAWASSCTACTNKPSNAYYTSNAASGNTCSWKYPNCTLPWWSTLNSWSSISWYSASSTTCPTSCSSKLYTCSWWVLKNSAYSGTYNKSSCSAQTWSFTCSVYKSWYTYPGVNALITASLEGGVNDYTTCSQAIYPSSSNPQNCTWYRMVYYFNCLSWAYGVVNKDGWRCYNFKDLDVYYITSTWSIIHKTLMDRNLWASTTWAWNSAPQTSYWYYYQWWNNYWFQTTWTITSKSSTRVNASSYWPSNPYLSGTFITASSYWDSSMNDNLWWYNGTLSSKQWPCPSWYHVPVYYDDLYDIPSGTINDSNNRIMWFMLPSAWYRNNSTTISDAWSKWRYWTAYGDSDDGEGADVMEFSSTYFDTTLVLSKSYWASVRCFKNTTNTSISIYPDWGTGAIISISNGKIVALWVPGKTWYTFWGWYSNSTFTTSVSTWSTAPSTIYAKWNSETIVNDLEVYILSDTGIVRTYFLMDRNVWATSTWAWSNAPVTSYWKYYQWWNNYWFPTTWNILTSGTRVSASWYWPNNPYSRNIYVISSSPWDTSNNANLWWHTTNTNVARRWPCPEWYHVPSSEEIGLLWGYYPRNGTNFAADFWLPFAGVRRVDEGWDVYGTWTYCNYWTSNANNSNRWTWYDGAGEPWTTFIQSSEAYPVRCFKNNDGWSALAITPNWWVWAVITYANTSNGGSIVRLWTPTKTWYTFDFWYCDDDESDRVTTWSSCSSIYAKWSKSDKDLDVYFVSSSSAVSHYTIMDRNLWATTTWAWSSAPATSFWKYYQWWNNYAFATTGSISTRNQKVYASSYWPSNPYNSWYFLITGNWDSSNTRGLRWEALNTNVARKWPCPEWYHVPSSGELIGGIYNHYMTNSSSYNNMASQLWLPTNANYRTVSAGSVANGSTSYLWTSTRTTSASSVYAMYITNGYASYYQTDPSYWYNVRCFKNDVDSDIEVYPNWWKNAEIVVYSWKIVALTSPSKAWYSFEWWYSDSSFNNRVYERSNAPSELYAKFSAKFSSWDLDLYFIDENWNVHHSNTIQDRNLWATATWYWYWASSASYWKYYQWWNNYWFSSVPSYPSSSKTSASSYWPNNYYNSSTFRAVGTGRDSSNNSNLWWNTTNTNEARRWPCPAWYHVPSISDLGSIRNEWTLANSTTNYSLFVQDLLIPHAWFYFVSQTGTVRHDYAGDGSYLWCSAQSMSYMWGYVSVYGNASYSWSITWQPDLHWMTKASWLSIRCFKNDVNGGLNIHPNWWTGATIQVTSWVITKLWSPRKTGYSFWGWYSNSSFSSAVVNWTIVWWTVTDIYAKRVCQSWYYMNNLNTCTKCTAWYKCSDWQNRVKCSSWTYSSAWASSCTSCSCGKYSWSWASSCTTCPSWTYSSAWASSCTTCNGTLSSNQCTCNTNSSCFPAWTQVFTENWMKNIEDVQIWDMVLWYNEVIKKNEYNRVTETFVHEDVESDLYELTINWNILKVTNVHPFYVVREWIDWYQWIEAQYLKVWDKLLMQDGEYEEIEWITHYPYKWTVYNLEVANTHDYYVDKWYLVHNKQELTLDCDPFSCFPAWTQVLTENWTKNIEDIEVWDVVLSYDTDLQQQTYNKVTDTVVHENFDDRMVEITVDWHVLKATMGHRFYVIREDNEYQCDKNGWKPARHLKEWDVLLRSDWTYAVIEWIKRYAVNGTFYNLEVENTHWYYVDEWYLVHNGPISSEACFKYAEP